MRLPQQTRSIWKDIQFFSGQPVFSQLLSLINRDLITKLSKKHGTDKYYKRFKTYDHLVTMLYSVFHHCSSIREVTTGMQACFMKLNHLGMSYCPRRSTLSDANKNRDSKVFLGDNENAIKIQIWCSLIADLILMFIKSRLKKNWAYANLNAMIRIHLMSYIKLMTFLENPEKSLIHSITRQSRGPTLFD